MMMNIDFPTLLVILTLVSGMIALIDWIFFARARAKNNEEMPLITDYARSFFPIFLLVLLIRSFIMQPFTIPSGSMEPTLLPKDFVAVNQFAYGLRLPVLNKKILSIGEPKRGDIVVFRYPGDPHVDFIKRVIGLPGDHVVYKNKRLTINGQPVSQTYLNDGVDLESTSIFGNIPSTVFEENLGGIKYAILQHKTGNQELGNVDVIIPKHMYFMMGDNRDNSGDSRFFGFVPEDYLIGKAFFIWLSWGNLTTEGFIRWSRLGWLN